MSGFELDLLCSIEKADNEMNKQNTKMEEYIFDAFNPSN